MFDAVVTTEYRSVHRKWITDIGDKLAIRLVISCR